MRALPCMVQWVSVVIANFFLVVSANAFSEIEGSIKKVFQVGSGGKLTIETDRGSIEVRTVESDTLEVEVIRKLDARDREEADEILKDFHIEFSQSGNDVHIHAEFKKDWHSLWGWRGRRLRLRYLVSVPRRYNVDLKTSGGSISVDDLEGEVIGKTSGGSLHFGRIKGAVSGKTSGGSIKLANCAGTTDIRTSGGSITIGEVEGKVTARTSGGSIRIDRARGSVEARTSGGGISVEDLIGEVNAKTSGGSVTARIFGQPQADCSLSTSGGNVVVYLADDVAVDMDATTSGGHVETEIPISVQGMLGKNRVRAKINGGGPELLLRTSGGSIYLRKL